jgi:hypothetical protein
MIFLFEALPESIVRRYFLQVPALLNLRFPGSHMPVGSTDTLNVSQIRPFIENEKNFRKFCHGGCTQNSILGTTTVTEF